METIISRNIFSIADDDDKLGAEFDRNTAYAQAKELPCVNYGFFKDEPYKCPHENCNKSFTRNENLKKHIDADHTDASKAPFFPKLQCSHCDITCVNKQVLQKHFLLKHREQYLVEVEDAEDVEPEEAEEYLTNQNAEEIDKFLNAEQDFENVHSENHQEDEDEVDAFSDENTDNFEYYEVEVETINDEGIENRDILAYNEEEYVDVDFNDDQSKENDAEEEDSRELGEFRLKNPDGQYKVGLQYF